MGTTEDDSTLLPEQSEPKPLDRRILALSLARLADAVGNSFLFILLPIYIASGTVTGDSFGMSETLFTGLVLGIFGLLSSLAQPFAGNLSDRLGRRKVFITGGLALLGVTTAAFAFAESYAAILIIRALQGVGVALTLPATIALVNEFSTQATRGRNMGVFNTFQMFGLGIAPVVTGVVVERGPYVVSAFDTAVTLSGFDAAFYVAAVTVFVSQLLVMLFLTDPQKTEASARSDLDVSVIGDSRTFDSTFALGVASLLIAVLVRRVLGKSVPSPTS